MNYKNEGPGECAPAHGPAVAPPKRPWDVDIDVHLESGGSNPKFRIHTCLPVDPVTGNILFQNNHRPGFNVSFNLFDETGGGYVFPPQPKVKEACWSKIGTSCPTSAVWEVFDPRRVTNGGTTLEVYNDNPTVGAGGGLGPFQYTLRVTNDGGSTYCDLDPGGTDMNGQRF